MRLVCCNKQNWICLKKLKSRRDFNESRRDFNESRRDFNESRRDFNFRSYLSTMLNGAKPCFPRTFPSSSLVTSKLALHIADEARDGKPQRGLHYNRNTSCLKQKHPRRMAMRRGCWHIVFSHPREEGERGGVRTRGWNEGDTYWMMILFWNRYY